MFRNSIKRSALVLWRASYLSVVGGCGYLGYSIYKEMNPKPQRLPDDGRKKLVVLGTGWGAISMLKHLDTSLYNVTVVSPRNYFLFTPLLPSVPTGTIDAKSIVDPVRNIAKQTPLEVSYLEAEATHIDPVTRHITVQHSANPATANIAPVAAAIQTQLDYDYLVIAVGAQPNTFGTPGVYEHAYFLKELSDAVKIRSKLMQNIELAQLLPRDSPERERLLTFTVIGGGPTGVELAAEVKDYIDDDLCKWFPGIEGECKVQLIEALPNILNSFNPKLISYSEFILNKIDIDLRVNTMVKNIDSHHITATTRLPNGDSQTVTLPYGVLVWATGNGVRPVVSDLANQLEDQTFAKRGLLVNSFLKVNGALDIFLLGDCTFTKDPPTAQVAHQQGIYLANLLENLARIDELELKLDLLESNDSRVVLLEEMQTKYKQQLKPFKYSHMGALAYIGSERAVADLVWGDWNSVATGGSLTFLFWRVAYVAMSLSVKNKVLICLDWLKMSIFGRDCSKE